MLTVITSKYQTTIPKKIRERLHLSVHDTLDWDVKDGRIIVSPVQARFLGFQGSIKTGSGDIDEDILIAREKRGRKYE